MRSEIADVVDCAMDQRFDSTRHQIVAGVALQDTKKGRQIKIVGEDTDPSSHCVENFSSNIQRFRARITERTVEFR